MTVVDSLFTRIDQGRKGGNKGIPTGLPDLDKYTYGVQRKYMYLIGGDSGSGKTTFALYCYLYKPLCYTLEHPETPVDILFYSLEMDSETLLAKLLSLYILDTYHVRISYKKIFSLDERLTDEEFKYIQDARTWLDKIDDHLTIYDKSVNAAVVNTVTRNWASHFGEFKENSNREMFIPNNPNQFLIVAVDHLRLLVGNDKRTEINNCADSLVTLRDLCKLSVILIQQLNRNFKNMERRQSAYSLIESSDFADASGPYQGAECVLALYHPHREKRATCEKYDIKQLRDSFRLIQCIKQRYGAADVSKGVFFCGEVGYYKELPNPEEFEINYDEVLSPEFLYKDTVYEKKKSEKKHLIEFNFGVN